MGWFYDQWRTCARHELFWQQRIQAWWWDLPWVHVRRVAKVPYLVGGLEHFLFSHILGIIIPIDFHFFQRGGPTTNQLWWILLTGGISTSFFYTRDKLVQHGNHRNCYKPTSADRELSQRSHDLDNFHGKMRRCSGVDVGLVDKRMQNGQVELVVRNRLSHLADNHFNHK